jgi:phage shock protein A
MFDGKTLKHLRADEVEDYRAAIDRGRQLKQIDRKIEKLQQRLFALITTTQTKATFTDVDEQECLVKELLAQSQKLRDSLLQLDIVNQRLKTQTQESGVKIQELGVRIQELGVRIQELGVRSQESGVRSQESGVRSQESGVRSQESGVRSQESGVRSQESGVRSQS